MHLGRFEQIPLVKAALLELNGQTADARNLLDDVQHRWPEGSAVWVARGVVFAAHSNFAEARKALETAVALGARSPEAFYHLADCTLHAAPDAINIAEAAVARALALAPEDPWAHVLAAQIAVKKGEQLTVSPQNVKSADPYRLFQTRPPQDW